MGIINIVFTAIIAFFYLTFMMMVQSALFGTIFYVVYNSISHKLGLPYLSYIDGASLLMIINILKHNFIAPLIGAMKLENKTN